MVSAYNPKALAKGKLIIFTAPSGAGKTTIVKHLLSTFEDKLAFSVSATSRAMRENEVEGKHYYFLSPVEFRRRIEAGDFMEWQEVYEGQYYGTLKSEIERLWDMGKHILFDIDVKGALNLQQNYPQHCLTVFVKPPSMDALVERLKHRGTEDSESFRKRIRRAAMEMAYQNEFHRILLNDDLEEALAASEDIIRTYLGLER